MTSNAKTLSVLVQTIVEIDLAAIRFVNEKALKQAIANESALYRIELFSFLSSEYEMEEQDALNLAMIMIANRQAFIADPANRPN